MTRARRVAVLLGCLALLALVLGCGGAATSLTASYSPRWACPSPTPRPYGEDGPVKDTRTLPTATPSGPVETEPVYYAIWEQEYPDAAGPPFPSPTPYAMQGTSYVFGQRVQVATLFATVSATAYEVIAPPDGQTPQQRYRVQITWHNLGRSDIPFDYATQVFLRAVTSAEGSVQTGQWGTSDAALISDDVLPDRIPVGESQVAIPIFAPPGDAHTVEVLFFNTDAAFPPLPTVTTLAGTPSPTPPPPTPTTGTPTPNAQLAQEQGQYLAVQWLNTSFPADMPPCGDPGAMTAWEADPAAIHGQPVANAIAAPPGAGRLVQIALNQVGKPYVFGAKGPEQFDCSGLCTWSYAQIGIAIPHGTGGQWPLMTPVDAAHLQPGDLVFFDWDGDGVINHVGMLVGSLQGNGQWDMVHAGSPKYGVAIVYDVFNSPAYGPYIVGFRTARTTTDGG